MCIQAVPGRSVDIRTSPELLEELGDWLEQRGIAWNVMIEDVGVLMEAEKVVLKEDVKNYLADFFR